MNRCLCWMVACWIGSGLVAATPEPLPPYSSASALREDASLHAVAFQNETTGVAVGDRGTIFRSEDGGETWKLRESGVDCRLDDVIWLDTQRVLVVGGGYDRITALSRGVVLASDDGGQNWKPAGDEDLPRLKSLRLREDRSIVAVGDWSHPSLSQEFESHDRGRTWDSTGQSEGLAQVPTTDNTTDLFRWARATGVHGPIRDACQVGENMVCAIGDHGVIVVSRDRGKTWTTTRGKNRRPAVLVVADSAASVPWLLVGSEALESRHRISVLICPSDDPNRTSSPRDLVHQVAVMLGASGSDEVIADQADLSRRAMEWMVVCQPATVVLDQSLSSEWQDAFFQAASSTGVHRIALTMRGGSHATIIHRDAILPRTGVLASDLAVDAMHYIAPHHADAASISIRFLYDAASSQRTGESVASGLPLHQGFRISDRAAPASRRELQIVQARMKQSKRIGQLIQTSRSASQFSKSLGSMLDQTAKADQFRLAWSMLRAITSPESVAKRVTSTDMEKIVLEEIALRFADTSAGGWARLRRESIAHSVEWKQLESTLTSVANHQSTPETVTPSVTVSPFQVSTGGVRQVSNIAPVFVAKPETLKFNRALPEKPNAVDLGWEYHPLVLLNQDAAKRRGDGGQLQVAEGQSANLRRLAEVTNNSWSRLLQTSGPQVVRASLSPSPPRLDGVLDDGCWLSGIRLAGRSQAPRFAYDDDYVYIAIQCRSELLDPDSTTLDVASTIRDHDLRNVDRIQLSLDTDQDLMTSMQLQVTDTRRTRDVIDGNPAWQPTWYVAAKRTDSRVTFEMAIVRRDLVDLPLYSGQSWFVSTKVMNAGSQTDAPVMPNPNDWVRLIFDR